MDDLDLDDLIGDRAFQSGVFVGLSVGSFLELAVVLKRLIGSYLGRLAASLVPLTPPVGAGDQSRPPHPLPLGYR